MLNDRQFPWFAVDHITIATRDQLFEAADRMARALLRAINRAATSGNMIGLDRSILYDLVRAAVHCPGFTELQKVTVVQTAQMMEREFGLVDSSKHWPFIGLARSNEAPDDVVDVGLHVPSYSIEPG